MMNKKLKPCPFCGGEAVTGEIDAKYGVIFYCVCCESCNATIEDDHLSIAIENWNKRVKDEINPKLFKINSYEKI